MAARRPPRDQVKPAARCVFRTQRRPRVCLRSRLLMSNATTKAPAVASSLLTCAFPSRHVVTSRPVTCAHRLVTSLTETTLRPENRFRPAPLNCPPQRYRADSFLESFSKRYRIDSVLESFSKRYRAQFGGAGANASWGSVFAFGSAAFFVSVLADPTLQSIEAALASVRHSDVSRDGN